MKSALVAGHTGLVGRYLLQNLLRSDKYHKVIAVGRKKVEIAHPKLVQYILDLNNIVIDEAVNDVFCALGTTIKKAGSKEQFRQVDYQYPMNLAQAGKQAGAHCFVLVSAEGANSKSAFFYNQVKGDLEDDLDKIGYDKLEILRPSLLLGNRQESRAMESVAQAIMKTIGFLFVGPLKNLRGIQAEKVANAMLVLANDARTGRRVHNSHMLQRF